MRSITATEFRQWLSEGYVGSSLVYFTGHLAHDREVTIVNPHIFIEPAHSLGREAFKAYRQGRVHLFQRRVDVNTFDYIAVKRPAPKIHVHLKGHNHAH